MTRADVASAYVYEGVWTNWSKGQVFGATWTLSSQNAAILISVISIFIPLVGTQLWKIIQLALHQARATAEARDGFYHQQQVVLRNGSSELVSLWQFLRIAYAWRSQSKVRSYRRSSILVLTALLHFIIFALAGILSSRLFDSGDEVLSRSPFCGWFSNDYLTSMSTTSADGKPTHLGSEFSANAQARCQQSQQYIQFCSDPDGACNGLPQRHLSWNETVQTLCPFAPQVCSTTHGESVVIDTGLISSHRHLGLNAMEEDRVQYRKVTVCTNLNDAKYVRDWKDLPATNTTSAKRVVDAYYGVNPAADRNATYSHSDWKQFLSFDQYTDLNPYQINVQFASANDSRRQRSTFVPIPELYRTDADLVIAFLSFSKVYELPINDPWFHAQQISRYPTPEGKVTNNTVYTRERPVTTMACTEQHQLCVGNDSALISADSAKCTPLTGVAQTSIAVNGLKLTSRQTATAARLLYAVTESSIYRILSLLGLRDTPLLARREIHGLVGLQLPNDQWQKEVLYWNSISMAHMQRSFIDAATGQLVADTSYINTTLTPAMDWLCQNQIIRGTTYQSFNLTGLILVFAIGTLIIIAGFTIEDCLARFRFRKNRSQHSYRRDMWLMNEMLEMFSLLTTASGSNIWSHGANGVPVAAPGQMMRVADLHLKFSPCDAQSPDKAQQSKFYSASTSDPDPAEISDAATKTTPSNLQPPQFDSKNTSVESDLGIPLDDLWYDHKRSQTSTSPLPEEDLPISAVPRHHDPRRMLRYYQESGDLDPLLSVDPVIPPSRLYGQAL